MGDACLIAGREVGYDFRFSGFLSQTSKINVKIIAPLSQVHLLSKPVNLRSIATLQSAIRAEYLRKSQRKKCNVFDVSVTVHHI